MQKNILLDKKKIRGFKKYIHKLNKLEELNKNIDFEQLNFTGTKYAKLSINPWYGLYQINSVEMDHLQPPINLKKVMIQSLLNIYYSWKDQIQNKYDQYYLKIWLYNERFMSSQVVLHVGNNISYYDNIFGREVPKTINTMWANVLNSKDLSYHIYEDIDYFDFDLANPIDIGTIMELKNLGGLCYENKTYFKKRGYILVIGQEKNTVDEAIEV